MSDLAVVQTTLPDQETAGSMARDLVSQGLAGCVHLGSPVTSLYRWKGNLCEEREVPLVVKTHSSRVPAVMNWLNDNHPYDCPERLVIYVDEAGSDYEEWMDEQVNG